MDTPFLYVQSIVGHLAGEAPRSLYCDSGLDEEAQARLNWATILNKRNGYRQAFDGLL